MVFSPAVRHPDSGGFYCADRTAVHFCGALPSKNLPLGGKVARRAGCGRNKESLASDAGKFRPAGRVTFWTPKKAPGGGANRIRLRLILHVPRPLGPPFTRVIPWTLFGPSGAQNQKCLGAIPSGPTGGLSKKKIGSGAVPLLRLGFPS